MPHDAFSHVTTWVFDLDHTLYPPEARLFDLIEVRMTDWVMEAVGVDRTEADRLRRHYWHTHGTTLASMTSIPRPIWWMCMISRWRA
jgi:putative hydrolase of the HAD superfamily